MDSGETHRCSGCQHGGVVYRPECTGCRRMNNLRFNTPDERPGFVVLPDKHTGVVPYKVTYGSTKILKRSIDM